jgi:hypothetical protein
MVTIRDRAGDAMASAHMRSLVRVACGLARGNDSKVGLTENVYGVPFTCGTSEYSPAASASMTELAPTSMRPSCRNRVRRCRRSHQRTCHDAAHG